jgi:amidase
VVGFKPPYGRVPEGPVFNLDFYCHEGPLARTVADTALMQNVIAGPHPLDIASIKPKLRIPDKLKSIRGFKIAYSLDLGYFKLDKDVRANTLAAIETFRDLGCQVEEVDLGWTEESGRAAWNYLSLLFGGFISPLLEEYGELMTPYARAFAEGAREAKSTDFVDSLRVAWEMNATFQPLMQRYDVFLCPTVAKPSIAADDPLDYGDFKAKGKVMPDGLAWCMTYPFNMLSRCPVISVPSGFARSGVPTGLQIVGRTYDDVRVFRAAAAFEKAAPWLREAKQRPKI